MPTGLDTHGSMGRLGHQIMIKAASTLLHGMTGCGESAMQDSYGTP